MRMMAAVNLPIMADRVNHGDFALFKTVILR